MLLERGSFLLNTADFTFSYNTKVFFAAGKINHKRNAKSDWIIVLLAYAVKIYIYETNWFNCFFLFKVLIFLTENDMSLQKIKSFCSCKSRYLSSNFSKEWLPVLKHFDREWKHRICFFMFKRKYLLGFTKFSHSRLL